MCSGLCKRKSSANNLTHKRTSSTPAHTLIYTFFYAGNSTQHPHHPGNPALACTRLFARDFLEHISAHPCTLTSSHALAHPCTTSSHPRTPTHTFFTQGIALNFLIILVTLGLAGACVFEAIRTGLPVFMNNFTLFCFALVCRMYFPGLLFNFIIFHVYCTYQRVSECGRTW
jgi:hypothetical protein